MARREDMDGREDMAGKEDIYGAGVNTWTTEEERKKAMIDAFMSQVPECGFVQQHETFRTARLQKARDLANQEQWQGAIDSIRNIEEEIQNTIEVRRVAYEEVRTKCNSMEKFSTEYFAATIERFWEAFRKHNDLLASYVLSDIIDTITAHRDESTTDDAKLDDVTDDINNLNLK